MIVDVLDGNATWCIDHTHVLDGLSALPDESVNCVMTSPPYFGLRSYSTDPQVWGGSPLCDHEWTAQVKPGSAVTPSVYEGEFNHTNAATRRPLHSSVCQKCEAWRGELGSEPTVRLYVSHMVDVFREVRRTLDPQGICFINIGDSYAGSGRGPGNTFGGKSEQQSKRQGFNGPGGFQARSVAAGAQGLSWVAAPPEVKHKSLCLVPQRLVIALEEDGWYVRQIIIWAKPNPMPESVVDRCTTSHEYVLFLSRRPRYFWDQDAIREKDSGRPEGDGFAGRQGSERDTAVEGGRGSAERWLPGGGRNARSVWEISTSPFPEAHFATFPPELARRCILAGCPEGGVVLDPFSGSGTVVMVALRHNRRGIGLELNPEYVEMSRRRIIGDAPLLNAEIAR